MNDIPINCPHCSQKLEVPEEFLGQTVECPSCSGPIQLPEPQPKVAPSKKVVAHKRTTTAQTDHSKQPSPASSGRIGRGICVLLEACLMVLIVTLIVSRIAAGRDLDRMLAPYAASLSAWLVVVYFNAAGYAALRFLQLSGTGWLAFNGFLCLALGKTLPVSLFPVLLKPMTEAEGLFWVPVLTTTSSLLFVLGVLCLLVAFVSHKETQPPSEALSKQIPPTVGLGRFIGLAIVTILLSVIAVVWVCIVNTAAVNQALSSSRGHNATQVWQHLGTFGVYACSSILLQIVGLLKGRSALKSGDTQSMRLAGIFLAAGSLQHAIIVGWPGLWAGISLIRCANAPVSIAENGIEQ